MDKMNSILEASVWYFLLVFGCGFIFGIIRELWTIQYFGKDQAELFEAPLMLLVIIAAAYWVMRHQAIAPQMLPRLSIGMLALLYLLIAELGVMLGIRGLSFTEYANQQTSLNDLIYFTMLLVYAVMPALIIKLSKYK